jgi:cell division transport system permease protein
MKRIIFHISKSWNHHFKLHLATLIVLIASFTVVAGVLTLNHNLLRILTLWGESMQVSVYLDENVNDKQILALQEFLKGQEKVTDAKLIDKDQALDLFREQMASYAPDILSDKDLRKFIPASLQFGINKAVAAQNQLEVMQELAASLKAMSGVEDVSYGQDWVRSYSAVTQTIQWAGHFFVLIILTAAAFVTANSIHNSISQRRNEVEVLELIGATSNYIRLPFLVEGSLLGSFAGILAVGFCAGLFAATKDYFHGQLAFLQLSSQISFIPFQTCLLIIIFGSGLGFLTSWLCLRNINDGWAAVQFQRDQ